MKQHVHCSQNSMNNNNNFLMMVIVSYVKLWRDLSRNKAASILHQRPPKSSRHWTHSVTNFTIISHCLFSKRMLLFPITSSYRFRLSATALVIAMGTSLQVGYFSVIYNVPQDVVEMYVNKSFNRIMNYTLVHSDLTWMWSSIVSANQMGKLLSCLLVPFFADKFGRKNSLIIWTIPATLSIFLQSVAYPTDVFHLLAAGRFLNGMYGGVVGVLVPLFFAEIARSSRWRSTLSRIYNVVTVFGSVLAFTLGLPNILGDDDRWFYLPLIPLIFLFLSTIWLTLVPESPLHLIAKRNSHTKIVKSLQFYGADKSLAQHKKVLSDETSATPSENWSVFKALKQKPILKLFVLWFNLAILASFAGGSLSQNYSTAMLSGFHGVTLFAKYASVLTAVVRLIIVVFVMHLIDKFGRRFLLLCCSYATLFCYAVLLMLAVFSYQFDDSTLTYLRLPFFLVWTGNSYGVFSTASLIVAETAPQNVRAIGLSMYKIVFYITGTVLTISYPHFAEIKEEYGYLLVGCPFLISVVYLTFACPETKHINMLGQKSWVATDIVQSV